MFCATFVLDLVWAEYIRAIAEHQVGKGTVHAGLIICLNAVAVIIYVGDPWMVPPAALGAMAGTYVSIRRAKP